MRILITGTNTINKGAELMLYSILQQIEKRYPHAEVLFPFNGIPEGCNYIDTNLNFHQIKGITIYKLFQKYKINRIFEKLNLPKIYFSEKYPIKNIDILFDAGGFQFADSFWTCKEWNNDWIRFLEGMHANGTKIIFLPQAFGPFTNKKWNNVLFAISRTVDLLFIRESVSYDYYSSIISFTGNVKIASDFTCLTPGRFPSKYSSYIGGIAIIPNIQMINSAQYSSISYINFLINTIQFIRKNSDRQIFFLNHEGIRDENLCRAINSKLKEKLPIISRLNALEVKGIISQCYLVISSRFHGVVSALNSNVPCFATSWSHKYEILFQDSGIKDHLLDIDQNISENKVLYDCLQEHSNYLEREQLKKASVRIISETQVMWNSIWDTIES